MSRCINLLALEISIEGEHVVKQSDRTWLVWSFGIVIAELLGMSLSSTAGAAVTRSRPRASHQPQYLGASSTRSMGQKSPFQSIAENFRLNYIAEYHGAAVADPAASMQPSRTGDPVDPITLTQKFNVGYQATNDLKLWVEPSWEWRPTEGPTWDRGWWWNDLNAGTSNIVLFRKSRFTLSTNIEALFPMYDGSLNDNLVVAPASNQCASYDIPNSRVTIGNNTTIRAYFYSGPGGGKKYAAYTGPFLTYTIAPTIHAGMNYDLNAMMLRDGSSLSDWRNDGTDLKFWIGSNISRRIELSLYVLTYPGNKVTAYSSKYGLVFVGTIL